MFFCACFFKKLFLGKTGQKKTRFYEKSQNEAIGSFKLACFFGHQFYRISKNSPQKQVYATEKQCYCHSTNTMDMIYWR